MSVTLTSSSGWEKSLTTKRSYTLSGSLSIPAYKTGVTVSFSFYCSANKVYSGYRYGFTVKMTCGGSEYSKYVEREVTSNRYYVEGSFTIDNRSSNTLSITGFSIQQTYTNVSGGVAYNRSENSSTADVSGGSTYYTKVSTPGAPSLSANNVLPSTTVALSWGASSGGINTSVSKYHVYRNDVYLGETTGTSMNVTSPSSNGSYTYKVYAISSPSGYNSDASSTVTLTTSVGSLSAPTNVSLDATYKSPGETTTLRWNSVSNATNNTVSGYRVLKNGVALGTTTTTSYTVTAESTGSATYTVVAIGSYSDSPASSGVTLNTYTSPTAPSTVSISESTAAPGVTLTLSWSGAADGANNTISGYEIYRSTSATTGYTKYGNTLAASTSSVNVVSSSTQGGTYYYKVRVLGTRGGSNDSDYVTVTTYVYTAVAPPSTISITPQIVPSGGSATLEWGEGTGTTHVNVTSYQVWYCTTQNGTYQKLGNNTSNRSMSVYGPSSGSYYYKVQSIADISGYDSALSSVIAVLTVNTAPSTPTNLSVTPANYNTGNLSFSWSASTDPDGDTVYYRIVMDIEGTTTGIVQDLTVTSYSVDLTAFIERGKTATFYVYAYDSNGATSAASDSATVTRVQSATPEDIELVNYTGVNCYSHYPKLLYKAKARLKLSATGWTAYPAGYVDADAYIILTCNTKRDPSSSVNISVTINITDQYNNVVTTTQTLIAARPTYLSDPAATNSLVKASQMVNLRNLVDAQLRFIEGTTPSEWTSGDITAGVTPLASWLTHLTEIRTKIESIVTFINNKLSTNYITSPQWESIVVNCPKASAMNQICTYLRDNL